MLRVNLQVILSSGVGRKDVQWIVSSLWWEAHGHFMWPAADEGCSSFYFQSWNIPYYCGTWWQRPVVKGGMFSSLHPAQWRPWLWPSGHLTSGCYSVGRARDSTVLVEWVTCCPCTYRLVCSESGIFQCCYMSCFCALLSELLSPNTATFSFQTGYLSWRWANRCCICKCSSC